MTKEVLGLELREGHILVEHLPDGDAALHLIHHFTEYPGRFVGDHARRAFDGDGLWCCTVADHEHFHLLID